MIGSRLLGLCFHTARGVRRRRELRPHVSLTGSSFLDGLCELTGKSGDFIGESVRPLPLLEPFTAFTLYIGVKLSRPGFHLDESGRAGP